MTLCKMFSKYNLTHALIFLIMSHIFETKYFLFW